MDSDQTSPHVRPTAPSYTQRTWNSPPSTPRLAYRRSVMESSCLGKRRLNGAERAPPAFLPLGYEYGDADAVDHMPHRLETGEMDFFKREKRERKADAATPDDLGIKEEDITINVIRSISLLLHLACRIGSFPTFFLTRAAGSARLNFRWVCTTSADGRTGAKSPSTTASPPTTGIRGR